MKPVDQQALAAAGIRATCVHGDLVRIDRVGSSPLYLPQWLIDVAVTTGDPRRHLRAHVEGGERHFP